MIRNFENLEISSDLPLNDWGELILSDDNLSFFKKLSKAFLLSLSILCTFIYICFLYVFTQFALVELSLFDYGFKLLLRRLKIINKEKENWTRKSPWIWIKKSFINDKRNVSYGFKF